MFVFAIQGEYAEICFDFLCQSNHAFDDIAHPQHPRRPCGVGIRPHFIGCAVADDLAVVQEENSVSDGEGFILVVCDIDRGDFCFILLA